MWNLGSGSAVSAAAGASTRHTHAWTASASSVLQTPFITSPLSALTGLARHGAVSDTCPWHHGPARCSWVGRTGCLPEHVQAVPCSARTRQTQRRPGLTGPLGERLLALAIALAWASLSALLLTAVLPAPPLASERAQTHLVASHQ